MKVPPVVAEPHAEAAIFNFNILSMTGTGILLAGIVSGFLLGYSPGGLVRMYGTHALHDPLLAPDHRLHAGARLRHPLLGHRRDDGPRLRQHRLVLPVLRHAARLARRRGHRLGHRLERALRRPAEGDGAAARPQPGADGGGQLLGRRHGQDDRRPVDRRRLDRDQVVRPRGLDPALRVLPLDRARRPRRHPRHGAGLRAPVHRDGARRGRDRSRPRTDGPPGPGHCPGPDRREGERHDHRETADRRARPHRRPRPRPDRRARHPRLHPRLPLRRRPGRGGRPPRQPRRAVARAERRDRRRPHRHLPGREHRPHRRLDPLGRRLRPRDRPRQPAPPRRAST